MKGEVFIPRILAVLLGGAVFFFVPATVSVLLGNESRLMLPTLISTYAASGIGLGLLWPNVGWRLGLYLFAVWPPALLFSIFLAGEIPWNVRTELRSLFGYFLMLLAGCAGGFLGTVVRQRFRNNKRAPTRGALRTS